MPGLVLVLQKLGPAKGVMFVTVEEETGVADLVLWPDRYAGQSRLVLSFTTLAYHGKLATAQLGSTMVRYHHSFERPGKPA